MNATSIGGILRANPSHWLTGTIDDVALWSRALDPAEITSLFQDGTPVPFTRVQPLAVRSFKADFPAVAAGDSVTLRWDVTKNVRVEIDRIGDVTAQTVAGLGSIEVTLPSTRTFNMTLTRGEESVSRALTVYAIDGVAEGWTLIDNFDRYDLGLLNGQGGWGDLDANDFGVIEHEGNKFASPINGGEGVAVLALGPQTIFEGQQRTLFFRAYLVGDPLDPLGLVNGQVAVTDRRLRFGNEAGDNVGPGALITDADTPTFRYVGGYIGWNPASRDIGTFENPELLPDKAWNVWVDFNNGPFQYDNADPPVAINTGDLYSIHVAEEGTAQRFTVFSDQIASRNPIGQADTGFTTQDLDRLIIGAIAGHGALTNLFIDDIYLSKAGYNSTVPRPFGFTTPVVEANPPVMDIQLSGSDISITWDRGVLESTDAIGGTWALVPGATSPYTPPIDGAQRFYRASD